MRPVTGQPTSVRSFAARKAALLLPVLAAAATLTVACGGSDPGPSASGSGGPVPIATEAAGPVGSTGADIYTSSCARCHGANRQGKKDAPALDEARIMTLGDQRLEQAIRYGKGRMKGFPNLTTAQVQALMDYLKDF